ncbi:MAG: 50S ribosomal protein L10 [Deltaproteobacteria bacterium]|nr:50S ribosomal protein L10 [Deltaproteobacteria bacterium]
MLRRQKEKIVTEIHDHIKAFRLAILTTFTGLDVDKMTGLRNSLREVDSEYRVVKNTLIKKAAHDTDLECLEEYFVGSSAVIFTNGDPVRLCKVLKEFIKEHAQVEVKGGVLGGKALSVNEVEELASLPSREVLLARLLFLLQASKQGLVKVLVGIPQKLVQVLEAIRQKKES